MHQALQADQTQAGRALRKLAGAQYERARDLARENGLALWRESKVEWRLFRIDDGWALFPGIQRVEVISGPLLKLPTTGRGRVRSANNATHPLLRRAQ